MTTPMPFDAADRIVAACREALTHVAADSTVVVAVSGGPDSLAMLHGLAGARGVPSRVRLHVAHLDHMLRPESGRDAEFVEGIAAGLGLSCTVGRVNVKAFARKQRLSEEDAARRLRYGFLEGVVSDVRAAGLALGHTADDQAETVLLHMVRGSGLTGLRGMAPVETRMVQDRAVHYLRPLLGIRRAETEAACAHWGLTPLQDPTNASLLYTRNRVRTQVMPALREINPDVTGALLRLSSAVAIDLDFVDAEAERRVQGHVMTVSRGRGDATMVLVDRLWLLAEPPAIQRRVVRGAFARATGTVADLEAAHTRLLVRMLGARAGTSTDLPGGTVAATTREHLVVAPAALDLCGAHPLPPEPVRVLPGRATYPAVGGWEVSLILGRPCDHDDRWSVAVPADRIERGLWLRPWRRGDRLRRAGGHASRKVQDVFTDAGIPRWCRGRVPLLVAGDPDGVEVVWVAGHRQAGRSPTGTACLSLRPPAGAWCWCLGSA